MLFSMVLNGINFPEREIADFCRRRGVARLAVFGSVLRADFTPESDLDMLVEFLPGIRMGYFGFQDLEDELSTILGREVDLNTANSLSGYFRDEVLHEARPVYVAA